MTSPRRSSVSAWHRAALALIGIASGATLLSAPRVAYGQDTQQRATLLADSLAAELDHTPSRSMGYVLGGVDTVAGIALVYFAARDGSVPPGAVLGMAGAGVGAIGGFASTQVDPHYSGTVLGSSMDASLGTIVLSEGTLMTSLSKTPFIVASAGFYGRSVLRIVDALASRPTSREELIRDYRLVWTSAQRETVSTSTVRSIQRDLDGSGPWMSPWILHAPLLLGGAVDLAMLARSDYNSADRAATGYLGGLQLGFWLVGISLDTSRGRDRYRQQLEHTRMRVAICPGPGIGLGLTGRF